MKRLTRWTIAGIIAALAFGAGVMHAAPARAASGPVVTVDDDPSNNGRTRCTGTVITADLSTLTFVDNEKLTICPGTYTGEMLILDADNVKVIGKGKPVLHPAAGDYAIISASLANNLTIQGLTLDGAGLFTVTTQVGISLDTVIGGKITKNTFLNIREAANTNTCNGGAAIKIESATISVVRNTINTFQCYGVFILRSPNVVVQNNRINTTTTIGSDNRMIYGYDSPGLKVTGNTITSDWNAAVSTPTVSAVVLEAASGAKVLKNKVTNVTTGVTILPSCGAFVSSSTDGILVQGNKVSGAIAGVVIQDRVYTGATCSPGTNGDIVKGNKFLYPAGGATPVFVTTYDQDTGDGFAPSVTGLQLLNNRYSGAASLYSDNGGPGIGPVVEKGSKLVRR